MAAKIVELNYQIATAYSAGGNIVTFMKAVQVTATTGQVPK